MEDPEKLTLKLLQAIDERSDMSQRRLSQRLGVALGLTNSYLKRCIRKGFVKIREVPSNRYLYYLTPKGFAEKSRLTTTYLSVSFDFYREASKSYEELFNECQLNGWSRILLCGISELAEVAYLKAAGSDSVLVGVYDKEVSQRSFCGIDVYADVTNLPSADAFFVCAIRSPERFLEHLRDHFEMDRILVPSILTLRGRT